MLKGLFGKKNCTHKGQDYPIDEKDKTVLSFDTQFRVDASFFLLKRFLKLELRVENPSGHELRFCWTFQRVLFLVMKEDCCVMLVQEKALQYTKW